MIARCSKSATSFSKHRKKWVDTLVRLDVDGNSLTALCRNVVAVIVLPIQQQSFLYRVDNIAA